MRSPNPGFCTYSTNINGVNTVVLVLNCVHPCPVVKCPKESYVLNGCVTCLADGRLAADSRARS
jgi:hypothetical protein